jgi:hypothetical protein
VLHAKVHAPLEHPVVALATLGHAVAVPQAPPEVHDWTPAAASMPLPLHCVCPGAHEPVQAPLRHVWLVHAVAVLHAPAAEQVSTPFPEHWVVAGTHTPVQEPLTHAEATHGVAVPHVPFAWHDSTPLPLQVF